MMDKLPVDPNIIKKLKSGNVNAFDLIYQRYHRKVYYFALCYLKNKEDAEGIVQETFLRVWEKRDNIDTTRSFKSWLFTISYHLIIDKLRLRLKEKEYLSQLDRYFNISELTSDQEVDFNILISQIDKIVEDLPEKRKFIYKLSREKGLSHKEISEQLNISVKTVD